MNIKRILCPVDFSEFNTAANDYASTLAKSTGARIIYLHAFLPDVMYGNPELYDAEKEEKRLLKKMEQQYSPTADDVKASYVVQFGSPAEQIVRFADEYEIDLVVIGTHGRTGLRRVVMGSVAEAVVRRAECPVLAIKTETNVLEESAT